ncbi:MAG: HlyC/CorC family transporter [Lachnospiraceae bacterium]|nr:HlyC/CorC family transporter [Lachnospiraceae bacterium]
MNDTLTVQLIILFILFVLSAFFSSAETALTTVNKVRMRTLADEGDKRAASVLAIQDRFPKMLSAILIGNNIVNLVASSLTTVIMTTLGGSYLIGIGTGVLTFLILIFGEVVPKTAAAAKADSLALLYAGVILFLMKVFTPVILIIDGISHLILKLFRIDTTSKELMTENELKTYVDVSHEDGVIERGEKEIIYNVFDFSDAVAKDVMIPRIDMTCVGTDATYADIIKVFKKDMYTRIPVFDENPDNIIGLINMKDLILVKDPNAFKITDHIREGYYTYEFKKTADLMVEMREKMVNVAFVMSEYGATVGMITLEDLLEEIVGEIRDEYDSDEAELIQQLDEERYIVEGSMKIDDLNDALHTAMDSEDYDSIGGLIIEKLERIPEVGDAITLENGILLTVRNASRNRVDKVLIQIPDEARVKEDAEDDLEDAPGEAKEDDKES